MKGFLGMQLHTAPLETQTKLSPGVGCSCLDLTMHVLVATAPLDNIVVGDDSCYWQCFRKAVNWEPDGTRFLVWRCPRDVVDKDDVVSDGLSNVMAIDIVMFARRRPLPHRG